MVSCSSRRVRVLSLGPSRLGAHASLLQLWMSGSRRRWAGKERFLTVIRSVRSNRACANREDDVRKVERLD